jgi:hypothetical protein
VYQYAQKFNNLCQYGGYHVDTDMKMELFREGLNSKLAEWLNLVKFDSYPMLVNKAISQEDAMKRAQVEKKRKADSMPNYAQRYKIRIMQKTFPDFQQASQSEKLVAKLSHIGLKKIFTFPTLNSRLPSLLYQVLMVTLSVVVSSVVNQDTSLGHACSHARPTGGTG